jgi:hypothetical protein
MRLATSTLGCIAAVCLLAPPAFPQGGTLDALWPNENGRSWTYDLHSEALVVEDSQVRIYFEGTTTVPGGGTAQYLRQQTIAGPVSANALAAMVPDRLLRRTWTARPDLRARILRAVAVSPCPQDAPAGNYALLLNGEFAFRRTATDIAALRCDLADVRSWLWLVSDLTIGNTFTLQLIPDVASNIFLHGTIAAIEPATVPAGTFPGCVRVDYVVDYGLGECTDPSGNVTGTSRYETRGFVRYAPGIGPVESSEEDLVAEVTGACDGAGVVGVPYSRTTQRLRQSVVPVQPSTWGRLKAAYR